MTAGDRPSAPADVGQLLRSWRERRRLSQLELANAADVSARHVSFIETGRSLPSMPMIVRLAEQLDVPMRERNALLLAAGYAPTYAETPLDAPGMAPIREIIDQLLRGYDPYPALVFDAGYDIVASNRTISLLLDGVAERLLEPPANVMRLALHPDGLAQRIINIGQVRTHLLARLERHIDTWQSDRLRHLYAEVSAYPVADSGDGAAGPASTLALPMLLRHGDVELSLISAVSTFNTPLDVTVSELAIETFLPADPQTAKALSAI
jgi:transcriptional regulator with XRE-family HTH domain